MESVKIQYEPQLRLRYTDHYRQIGKLPGRSYVVAMSLETTEEELMSTVCPHPTLSEMMHESVLDAYGQVLHK